MSIQIHPGFNVIVLIYDLPQNREPGLNTGY
jgi:hypothetical protein